MNDDTDPCPTLHTTLAGHVLHAINIGYHEVAVTHLRERSVVDDDTHGRFMLKVVWEAVIVLEQLGIEYVARDTCPLEAALSVAAEVAELLEAMHDRAGLPATN
jgi:hypothetical protein